MSGAGLHLSKLFGFRTARTLPEPQPGGAGGVVESHTNADEKQLIPFRMAGFSQPKAKWTKAGTPKPPGRDHAITQLQSLQLSSSRTGSRLAVPRAPCTICAAAALVACTAARGAWGDAGTTAASQR